MRDYTLKTLLADILILGLFIIFVSSSVFLAAVFALLNSVTVG